MENFMKTTVVRIFCLASLALAIAVLTVRVSARPNPQIKSGVDRLYVIDCGGVNPIRTA